MLHTRAGKRGTRQGDDKYHVEARALQAKGEGTSKSEKNVACHIRRRDAEDIACRRHFERGRTNRQVKPGRLLPAPVDKGKEGEKDKGKKSLASQQHPKVVLEREVV